MAIYDLLEKIMPQIDNKVLVSALYMDMSKAFDFVDHHLLLLKLHRYGVRGNAHDLLKSYLIGRKQCTQVDRICLDTKKEVLFSSDFKEINYGVPQGSVLGPLLFLIYINDLPRAINQSMVLFADDSTVIFTEKNMQVHQDNINQALCLIIEWLNNNNLHVNLEKTSVMNFKIRSIKSHNLAIKYKDHRINESDSTKFLGLSLDNSLTWKNQIDIICKKLNQFSYALYNLRKIVSESTALTVYHAHVTATLRYGVMFWGNSTDRESVFKSQKKCLRSVCGIKPIESCKPHFIKLKILTLACLYVYEVSIYVKCNMNQFSKFNSVRQRGKICFKPSRTAFLSKSIFGMAPKIFNKLPTEIIKLEDFREFKNALLRFLLSKAYYSVQEYLTDTVSTC